MIIFFMDYKNMYYNFWAILKILLFWDNITNTGKKYNYIEKVLYIILYNR